MGGRQEGNRGEEEEGRAKEQEVEGKDLPAAYWLYREEGLVVPEDLSPNCSAAVCWLTP